MDKNREQTIQIITATQIADGSSYNEIYERSPLLAKFMVDKFKDFLNNPNITDLERKTILLKFLETQQDYDVIQQILQYLDVCDLKDDYITIIMEWTYNNSDKIIKNNLKKVDGCGLCLSRKESQEPQIETIEIQIDENQPVADFVQQILDIVKNKKDDGPNSGGMYFYE